VLRRTLKGFPRAHEALSVDAEQYPLMPRVALAADDDRISVPP
jgi:hypothetical protein